MLQTQGGSKKDDEPRRPVLRELPERIVCVIGRDGTSIWNTRREEEK